MKDVVCGCPPAGNEGFFSLPKKPPFTHIPVNVPYSTPGAQENHTWKNNRILEELFDGNYVGRPVLSAEGRPINWCFARQALQTSQSSLLDAVTVVTPKVSRQTSSTSCGFERM